MRKLFTEMLCRAPLIRKLSQNYNLASSHGTPLLIVSHIFEVIPIALSQPWLRCLKIVLLRHLFSCHLVVVEISHKSHVQPVEHASEALLLLHGANADASERVKCDRSHPCQNCMKRGQAATCTYPSNTHPRRAEHLASSSLAATMRQKVTRLETMLQLSAPISDGRVPVATDSEASPSAQAYMAIDGGPTALYKRTNVTSNGYANVDKASNDTGSSSGRFRMDNGETSWVGSAHWAAILDEVGIECIVLCETVRISLYLTLIKRPFQ